MPGKRAIKVTSVADAKAFARDDVKWQRPDMTDKELDDVIATSADMRNVAGEARGAYMREYRDCYIALETLRGGRTQ